MWLRTVREAQQAKAATPTLMPQLKNCAEQWYIGDLSLELQQFLADTGFSRRSELQGCAGKRYDALLEQACEVIDVAAEDLDQLQETFKGLIGRLRALPHPDTKEAEFLKSASGDLLTGLVESVSYTHLTLPTKRIV